MKYVMFRLPKQHGIVRFFFVMFPDLLNHSDIAGNLKTMDLTLSKKLYGQPVSAGSVYYCAERGIWKCIGHSISLHMKPHAQDDLIINTFDQLHGVGFDERKEVKATG